MVLPIIAAGIGGVLSMGASRSAASAQERAAQNAANAQLTATRESNDMLRDFRAEDIARLDPFYRQGLDAYNALGFELFGGQRPTVGGTTTPLRIETFTESTPGTGRRALTPAEEMQRQNAQRRARRSGGLLREYWQDPRGSGTPGTETTRYRVDGRVFDSMGEAQAYANQNALRTGGTAYRGFEESPGYEFRLREGLEAAQGSAAMRHGLVSGATIDAMNRTAQDFASNEYGNFYNRLAGMAGTGQNAATGMGSANMGYGSAMTGNIMAGGQAAAQGFANAGNAAASGIVGGANAINSAIGQGMGAWQMQNMLKAFQPAGNVTGNPAQFSGLY